MQQPLYKQNIITGLFYWFMTGEIPKQTLLTTHKQQHKQRTKSSTHSRKCSHTCDRISFHFKAIHTAKQRHKAREYFKLVFLSLKAPAAEEWPAGAGGLGSCLFVPEGPSAIFITSSVQFPKSLRLTLDAGWGQFQTEATEFLRIRVVITESLSRCESIPELRAAVCIEFILPI